ncbi:MAG: efflux RND transporter periplasmic adaptor subunit [Planctomycetes bacterium]|nr:efflux RND transporter periplasmic adaptor subunit [Planctomycetota bacterium]
MMNVRYRLSIHGLPESFRLVRVLFANSGAGGISRGLLSCLLLVFAGCGAGGPPPGPPQFPPPEVQVSLPIQGEVTDYVDFPGRIEAVNSVEVRARVTGYLEKVHFQEGSDVEQGDLLFEIDARPYEAELDRAEGAVIQVEGRLTRLNGDYERAQSLQAKGAMSKEEIARITGDRTEAQGMLKVNEAVRDLARLNLSFTKVRAPISGKISRRFIDPGNLVKADDTAVTTIVSLDPVYAYFDLDERTMLQLKRLIREQKIVWSLDAGLPVLMGLADERGFPRQGTINFADNRVDADTGTWRLRGRFDNGDNSLAPGLFVRVRLPFGTAHSAILITEEALGTDQGQKYLYVVGDDGKAEYRRVKIGKLHNGLREVSEGLTAQDKVVVNGLQRVRPGIEVQATTVPMPDAPETANQQADGKKPQG